MAGERILIVEDEARIADVLERYLRADGFRVTRCDRGDTALETLREAPPDLVVLDVMLPGLDGLAVCRELRRFSAVPVLMVTARVEEVDRLLGLELGADDYLCKPFSPRELVARVRAQLRRSAWLREASAPDGTEAPGVPGLTLHADELRARYRGEIVDLTRVEFRLLQALLAAPGRVYSRPQLMDAAYEDHRVVSDRTIDTHVKNLRRKLVTVLGEPVPIGSVYGVGYRWDPTAAPE
jgi:two-component system response regulator BaeR